MKKTLSFICMISFLFCCLVLPVNAQDKTQIAGEVIQVYEDGSYLTSTVGELPAVTRAGGTKTGYNAYSFYNAADRLLWTYTLYATFTYNGSEAYCQSSRYEYSIKDGNWKIYTQLCSTTYNGNGAYGNLCFKRYSLGICLQTVQDCITLYCNPNGELFS